MEADIIPGVDFAKLRQDAQTASEQIWDTLQDWDPLGRTHEDACPSYPVAQSTEWEVTFRLLISVLYNE